MMIGRKSEKADEDDHQGPTAMLPCSKPPLFQAISLALHPSVTSIKCSRRIPRSGLNPGEGCAILSGEVEIRSWYNGGHGELGSTLDHGAVLPVLRRLLLRVRLRGREVPSVFFCGRLAFLAISSPVGPACGGCCFFLLLPCPSTPCPLRPPPRSNAFFNTKLTRPCSSSSCCCCPAYTAWAYRSLQSPHMCTTSPANNSVAAVHGGDDDASGRKANRRIDPAATTQVVRCHSVPCSGSV